MIKELISKLGDRFWVNLRYTMIASGSAMVMNATNGLINEEHAIAIMTPLADIIIGFLMAALAWLWGNMVRRGTKTVPASAPEPAINMGTGEVDIIEATTL
jgi:hypothetical protein